jgi:uncharacterized protein (TIGR02996 family)
MSTPAESLRAALEQALLANPDDLATHMAYADHLSEQGDPRGEFISVQLALEDPACTGERRQELKRRELLLLAHERDWLGPLAPLLLDPDPYTGVPWGRIDWARGWLESVCLGWFGLMAARALVACPAARLLHRLDLSHVQWYEAGEEPEEGILPEDDLPPGKSFTALYALQRAPFLPHLRFFRIGEEVDFEQGMYNNEASGHGLTRVVERTPRLEELHILAKGLGLPRLFGLTNLTHLRYLLVYHHAGVYPLDVLAANPAFPALETLRLHPAHGEPGEEAYLPRDRVAAFLHSPHFPALRHLHLHASDLGDEGCWDIVESGILKRLKVLDLRFGRIGDEGARILADCPDTRRLEHLSLEDNELTMTGRNLLHGLGIDVRMNAQYEPGSDQYLWSGDME